MNLLEFSSGIDWRPGIGDPSPMGWLTVVAYVLVSLLSLKAAQRYHSDSDTGQDRLRRRMWLGVASLMSFLGINKQLDLQSLFTEMGREIAFKGGWYSQRRSVQFVFVVAVAAIGIAGFIFIMRKTHSILRERKLLLFGLSFLISFIIIRAASFHHVGTLFASRILGLRINWILELGGIAFIGLSALQANQLSKKG
jgi:hypothetical protein